MNNITIRGIKDGDQFDDRVTILLTVQYNDELFDWFVKLPKSYTGTFGEYVDSVAGNIYTDIEAKLEEWNNLEPKVLSVTDELTGQIVTIPLDRSEIVKPTYPDYYVLRAREYPNIAEQLDSFWKGGASALEMQEKIAYIKSKYPKA